MASHFSDDRRRADILRRTRDGLREDLDDLREELATVLPDYELRLNRLTDQLPEWLDFDPAAIRQLFHFEQLILSEDQSSRSSTDTRSNTDTHSKTDAHPGDPSILGPRVVAIAAGHIEAFIHEWMRPDVVDAASDLPPDHRQLTRDYTRVTQYLRGVDEQAREVADQARRSMDFWLDAILSELDKQREVDVEALEELVHQGDIRRGQRARQEIADRWEEQRRQAAELQRRWRPIVALLGEGLQAGEAGLEELSSLISRTRDGLVGAFGALADLLEPFDFAPAGATRRLQAVDEPASADSPALDEDLEESSDGFTETQTGFAPIGFGANESDEDASHEDALNKDENRADLSQDDTPSDLAERTDPDDALKSIEPDSPIGVTDAHYTSGIIPLDEPTSEPEALGLESSSVSDYAEPADYSEPSDYHRRAAAGTQPQTGKTDKIVPIRRLTRHQRPVDPGERGLGGDALGGGEDDTVDGASGPTAPQFAGHASHAHRTRAAAGKSPGALSRNPDTPHATQDQWAPEDTTSFATFDDIAGLDADNNLPGEDLSSATDPDEATFSTCFRVRPGYKRVGLPEVLAVLAPPVLLLGTMALFSALYLAGINDTNPFERWSWAMSAVAAGAAWLFLVPTGLRWRSKWRGIRPMILRHTDVREQVELVFDTRGLRLGQQSWSWDEVLRANLRRWDSPLDEVCGWALSLQLPGAQPLELAAPESNRKKWQNAPYQLGEVPYQAWQLDIFDFEAICRRAMN